MIARAFIDASNLFYGGEKSLGWKIDYQKLLQYLEEKYGVSNTYYFGGVELHDFPYDYQRQDTVPVGALKEHLSEILNRKAKALSDSETIEVGQHLQRARFYCKLAQFGYDLYLKPVKSYEQEDGATRRKANCDVEMTFHLMKDIDRFDSS